MIVLRLVECYICFTASSSPLSPSCKVARPASAFLLRDWTTLASADVGASEQLPRFVEACSTVSVKQASARALGPRRPRATPRHSRRPARRHSGSRLLAHTPLSRSQRRPPCIPRRARRCRCASGCGHVSRVSSGASWGRGAGDEQTASVTGRRSLSY